MKAITLLITTVLLIESCNTADVRVSEGIDSDFRATFSAFGHTDMAIEAFEVEIGQSVFNPYVVIWNEKDDFIKKLHSSMIAGFDSVRFVNESNTRQLVFINPQVDDSLDYKLKTDAHFWNIVNWYSTDDAVFYLLTKENFELYGEDI